MSAAVEPLDRGTFRVASASVAGKSYFVDVTENNGLGQCDCEDFRCRAIHRCRHILQAREFIVDCVGAELRRQESSGRASGQTARCAPSPAS